MQCGKERDRLLHGVKRDRAVQLRRRIDFVILKTEKQSHLGPGSRHRPETSCVIGMARKKIREHDSKRLLKAHIMRLKNVKLPLNVSQACPQSDQPDHSACCLVWRVYFSASMSPYSFTIAHCEQVLLLI